MGIQFDGINNEIKSQTKIDFPGSVGVAGTLTYEDVANVDSIGIITARNGLIVNTGAGATFSRITLDASGNNDTVTTTGSSGLKISNSASIVLQEAGGSPNTYASFSDNGLSFYRAGSLKLNHTGSGFDFYDNLIVNADSTYDIGTNSTRWRNVYADTFYGSGANLTNLDASDLASGTVPTARLGSGTASSSTFLAGDSTYKTVTGTTINNNANNRIITGSGTANTLEGESTFTFDGTKVHLNAGSTSHIQIDGTASYLQVAGIKVWVGAGNRAHNTAVGNGALNAANGGDDCTAIGHNAYANGTSGEDNTVVGSHAMDDNVTGHRNCGFGHASLTSLTSGYNNSCYGRTSGFSLLNGHNNTFLGYDAGYTTTSGVANIFVGSGAGKYESTSSDNVAIGYNCFGANRSGGNSNQFNKNTVVGHQALTQQRVANGDGENVCIGYRTMYNTQTAAWRNVVIGFEAGYNNQASKTTFVGTFAGKSYQSGGNTMCLGYNAGTSDSPSGNLTNQQDTIVLGNNGISQLYCSDTSISSSDARDKTDITEWTHGLSFINQLKPVTYRWDKRTWYGTDEEPIGTPDGSKKRARLHFGFLAQDALEVEKSFGYASKKDDMLAVNLNEDDTAYGMKYERLVVPLTKAVQELSAEIDKLKAEIAALKSS